jgi:hypothetical protein
MHREDQLRNAITAGIAILGLQCLLVSISLINPTHSKSTDYALSALLMTAIVFVFGLCSIMHVRGFFGISTSFSSRIFRPMANVFSICIGLLCITWISHIWNPQSGSLYQGIALFLYFTAGGLFAVSTPHLQSGFSDLIVTYRAIGAIWTVFPVLFMFVSYSTGWSPLIGQFFYFPIAVIFLVVPGTLILYRELVR